MPLKTILNTLVEKYSSKKKVPLKRHINDLKQVYSMNIYRYSVRYVLRVSNYIKLLILLGKMAIMQQRLNKPEKIHYALKVYDITI